MTQMTNDIVRHAFVTGFKRRKQESVESILTNLLALLHFGEYFPAIEGEKKVGSPRDSGKGTSGPKSSLSIFVPFSPLLICLFIWPCCYGTLLQFQWHVNQDRIEAKKDYRQDVKKRWKDALSWHQF